MKTIPETTIFQLIMVREPTINNPKIIPPTRLSKEHKALAVAET